MNRLSEGDRMRVDIPDQTDPDHDRYHGVHGTIVGVVDDDAGAVTGDASDSTLYRLELETGETADFRRVDLRPPIE